MIRAYSYEIVCEELKRAFEKRYELTNDHGIRLVGLLFARPGSPLVKSQITDNLDDFHHRSGNHVDFFCAGYGGYWNEEKFPDQVVVGPGKHTDWLYSSEHYNAFRKEIEMLTKWRYSGGVDLLIANAKYSAKDKSASIDFKSTIICQLDEMLRIGTIISVETFFEKIFQYCEENQGTDPAWGFSDKIGKKEVSNAFIRLILSLLPKNLGKEAEKLSHLAIRDVSLA